MDTTRTNVYIKTKLTGDLCTDMKIHTLCERYPYVRFFAVADEIYFYRFRWLLNLVLISPREDGSYRIVKEMQPLRIGIFARRLKDKYVEYLRTLTAYDDIISSLESECDMIVDVDDWDDSVLSLASMPAIPEKKKAAVAVPYIPNAGLSEHAPAGAVFPERVYSAYASRFSAEIKAMLSWGYSVQMQSFSRNDGSEFLMQKIMDALSEEERPKVFCVVYDNDIDALLREFAESEVVITTRPEAKIFATLCKCRLIDPISENYSENLSLSDEIPAPFKELDPCLMLESPMSGRTPKP